MANRNDKRFLDVLFGAHSESSGEGRYRIRVVLSDTDRNDVQLECLAFGGVAVDGVERVGLEVSVLKIVIRVSKNVRGIYKNFKVIALGHGLFLLHDERLDLLHALVGQHLQTLLLELVSCENLLHLLLGGGSSGSSSCGEHWFWWFGVLAEVLYRGLAL